MTAGPVNPEKTHPAGGTDAAGQSGAATGTVTDASLVAMLTLAEKVLLLTGADSWRTQGAAALGLRPITTSDGPAGARGVIKDERFPSSSLPCPSALGATWDTELVREVAAALGAEARSKGVDVLLGPTINLMRTPLGGRGFECFAEDPVLTAVLAVEYVRGLQGAGVAATVKHYVGNDSETERWSYDARIAENVLRELYLPPFEACVREAGSMLVMAAYNMVNGVPMTEHERLLKDVLKGEWGFDGVVTSDWHAARSTTATALATLDLSMPGPDGPWGELLAQAVADGAVRPAVLDDKVVRLLRLARRVGALGGAADAPGPPADPQFIDPRLLRRATAAATRPAPQRAGGAAANPERSAASRCSARTPSSRPSRAAGARGSCRSAFPPREHALRTALAGQTELDHRAWLPDLGAGARAGARHRSATRTPASPGCGWSSAPPTAPCSAASTATPRRWPGGIMSRRASAGARPGGSCCSRPSGPTTAGRT